MLDPQPAIELLGIQINEPVTTFTDLIVSGVCLYAFIHLRKLGIRNKACKYLCIYFISMALATAIGGLIGHGFMYLFNPYWKLPGWLTSMVSVAMVERASIEYARKLIKPKTGIFFSWLNIVELLTFMVITFTTLNFFFVEAHSAYGLLVVVFGFNFWVFKKTKEAGSRFMLIAVGISAISALIYMNEWGISKWFNHYDISHCFMAISAFFFYKGAREIVTSKLAE